MIKTWTPPGPAGKPPKGTHSCPDYQAPSPRPHSRRPLSNAPVSRTVSRISSSLHPGSEFIDKKNPRVGSVASNTGCTVQLESGRSCHTPKSRPWDTCAESWVAGAGLKWQGLWAGTGFTLV